jgi:hypothetical protein
VMEWMDVDNLMQELGKLHHKLPQCMRGSE